MNELEKIWAEMLHNSNLMIMGAGLVVILLIIIAYFLLRAYLENREYRDATGKDDD